jgi:aminomethyltransferase
MKGYEALRSTAAWIDLSSRGKIRVTGEDRARLLHAMCTNHVQGLSAGEGLYAFFLTAQGRILADAYIYNLGTALFLDTEPETGEKLRNHLDRYIIADDATLEDETALWATIAVEGPETNARALSIGVTVPDKRYAIREWGSGFVTRVASTGAEGVRIFTPVEQKEELLRKLRAADIPEATGEEARTVRIENGIPRYGEDISERYLVQESQQVQAVHSNKGCYLGQEIVERVRSRGQVHRLLTPIHVKTAKAPEPGTKLTARGNPVGEITSATWSPALQEVAALAYVRAEALHDKPEMKLMDDPQVEASIR